MHYVTVVGSVISSLPPGIRHHDGGSVVDFMPAGSVLSGDLYAFVACRWNEKFDFVDVRADSIMLATVWDQATIIDAATSLKLSRVSWHMCTGFANAFSTHFDSTLNSNEYIFCGDSGMFCSVPSHLLLCYPI
jgi:hypothetical protein